jgi:hypothetical protein
MDEVNRNVTFAEIDTDRDGSISSEELMVFMLGKGVSEEEISTLFSALDTNADGNISQEEFRLGIEQYCIVCRAAANPGMRVVAGTGPQDPFKERPKDEDGNSTDPYCRRCQFKKAQCHCDSKGARLGKAAGDLPKLNKGDINFASWMLNHMCEHPGPGSGTGKPPKIQQSMANLTKYMQDNLDSKDEINLYRKQYGNFAQIFEGGKGKNKFQYILQLYAKNCTVASEEELAAAMEGGHVSEADFNTVKECRERKCKKKK